jgi:hypothetical protein
VSRETSLLAMISFVIALVAPVFGQGPQTQPSTALPAANVLGPQLIVWSQAQQPRPVPQPLPDPPEQQPAQQQPGQSANSQAEQQPAAQIFIGTITRDGSKYVLKESDGTTYQLDDQGNAKQYEGKQVKIVGNLEANSNTLHISTIQELP